MASTSSPSNKFNENDTNGKPLNPTAASPLSSSPSGIKGTPPPPPIKRARSGSKDSQPKTTAATMVQSSTQTQAKAPIYITIGPQCAGKTTLLSKLASNSSHNNNKLKDITIDDQEGVYIKIPTFYFLSNRPPDTAPSADSNQINQFLAEKILGKSLSQRIYHFHNDEMRFVLQRLHNVITAQQFHDFLLQEKTREYQQLKIDDEEAEAALAAAVTIQESNAEASIQEVNQEGKNKDQTETNISVDAKTRVYSHYNHERKKRQMELQNIKLELSTLEQLVSIVEQQTLLLQQQQPKEAKKSIIEHVDLFIQEAIFRPRYPKYNTSALDEAISVLNSTCTANEEEAAAWGNTNTRPREYKTALDLADHSKRPVVFIMYGASELLLSPSPSSSKEEKNQEEEDQLFFKKVGIKVLIERNVQRLLKTGKYIPCKAISDASSRCDNLLDNVEHELNRLFPFSSDEKEDNTKHKSGDNMDSGGTKIDATHISKERRKFTKLQLDMALAKLANYQMGEDRCVAKITPSPSNKKKHVYDENGGVRREQGGRWNGNSGGRGRYQAGRGGYQGGRGRYQAGRGQFNNRQNGSSSGDGKRLYSNNNGSNTNEFQGGERRQNGDNRGGRWYNNDRSNGGRYSTDRRQYDNNRGGGWYNNDRNVGGERRWYNNDVNNDERGDRYSNRERNQYDGNGGRGSGQWQTRGGGSGNGGQGNERKPKNNDNNRDYRGSGERRREDSGGGRYD